MGVYIAVLLSEARTSGVPDALYRESFVLLSAGDVDAARAEAAAHGRGQETAYPNADGDTVSWTLKAVVDVAEVLDENLGDGAEVYARHFRNYDAYRAFEPLLSGDDI